MRPPLTWTQWLLITGCWVAGVNPAGAQGIVPLSDEVRLPTPAWSCIHHSPDVAWTPDGGVLVVWSRVGEAIAARLSRSSGLAFGPEQVLAEDDWAASFPAIAVDPAGSFSVAWRAGPHQAAKILYQRFDDDGLALSERMEVTTQPARWGVPAIVRLRTGEMVVAWPGGTSVNFRQYSPDGFPLTEEITAGTAASGQGDGSVRLHEVNLAGNGDGDFIVAWSEQNYLSSPFPGHRTEEIFVRSFNHAGEANGPMISISAPLADGPPGLAVGQVPTGEFLIAWASPEGGGQILLQRLDRLGYPVARPVRVDAPESGPYQRSLRMSVDQTGVTMAWLRRWPDAALNAFGRRLDFRGQPFGEEFAINQPVGETWGSHHDLFNVEIDARAGQLAAAWHIRRDSLIIPTDCDTGVSVLAQTFRLPEQAVVETPTLSLGGLIALAVLLAAAGLRSSVKGISCFRRGEGPRD